MMYVSCTFVLYLLILIIYVEYRTCVFSDATGKLYPQYPKRAEVDSVLGLVGDLSRAWRPALYIGMRPTVFGHKEKKDWPEGKIV